MMEIKITDYNYIGSSIGNAYFSGVTYDQLWNCVVLSSNREELDAAVSATINFNKLVHKKDGQ
jgi:hypothetical protein